LELQVYFLLSGIRGVLAIAVKMTLTTLTICGNLN